MINISYFFRLAKVFGLAPYTLQVQLDQKQKRFDALLSRVPTFLMIILYAIFVCSIFWKNKAVSQISNTANWIQVKLKISREMIWILNSFHSQFIPNALIFFVVLVTAENSRQTIQSVGVLVSELDLRMKFFQVSFTRSYNRTKQLSLFALWRKSNVDRICAIKIFNEIALFISVVICFGGNIAILHYIIGVDASKPATLFYWLSFVIGKIGLLTFNFMFALYMTVLLERLRIVGKTLE